MKPHIRRRTLDVVISAGGIAVAAALVVLGGVFLRDANFAKNYVADQLGQQRITFKAAEALTDEEKQSECLVANAGQPLTTGKQAECYANEFIGLHLRTMQGANGMTYAELGTPQRELSERVAEARATGDRALPALEQELADLTATRTSMFQGETLRGLLLTTYGFSIFGEKAGQAAIVLFVIAGILVLLAAAGLVHAARTPVSREINLEPLVGSSEPVLTPAHRGAPRRTDRPARARKTPQNGRTGAKRVKS